MSTAIITGAGGGLGRAIVIRLAEDGFDVAGFDVDETALAETVELAGSLGVIAKPYRVDVRDETALTAAIDRVANDIGPPSVLVNNAAIFPSGPFATTTPVEYDDAVAVNQRAYFFAAQAVAAHMSENGGGAIVNIGSITEHGGWSEIAAYVVTKGAAAALTRALATELGPRNIRVNCVAPGAFPTAAEQMQGDPAAYQKRIIDSQALKRRGTVEELAAAVAFLASDDASFITGQTLNVDGGWIMA